ncbi:MAG: hypothetical protein PHR69_01830 [Sphaerochaeta sp.]|nr:hypothetical protein [Sphaerochaeta sp.]
MQEIFASSGQGASSGIGEGNGGGEVWSMARDSVASELHESHEPDNEKPPSSC